MFEKKYAQEVRIDACAAKKMKWYRSCGSIRVDDVDDIVSYSIYASCFVDSDFVRIGCQRQCASTKCRLDLHYIVAIARQPVRSIYMSQTYGIESSNTNVAGVQHQRVRHEIVIASEGIAIVRLFIEIR